MYQATPHGFQERLREYFREDGRGVVFAAPTDVLLSDHDVLVPDIVVVTNRSLMTARAVEGPPTIAVEILSPSNVRYDRVRKAERYATFGVPHTGSFAHPDFADLTFDVAALWDPDWTQ